MPMWEVHRDTARAQGGVTMRSVRSYAWCKHCAQGACSIRRHWHLGCRYCGKPKIFRGPSCRRCHKIAKELVKDLF